MFRTTIRHRITLLLGICCLALTLTAAADDLHLAQPRADLFTAGQPSAAQLTELAQRGVRHVIDLRGPDEARGYDEVALSHELGMSYLSLPISGADDLNGANAHALKQALDAADGPVLLHCASSNRVGALLALMAAQEEQLSDAEALQLGLQAGMKSLQPVVRDKLQSKTLCDGVDLANGNC